MGVKAVPRFKKRRAPIVNFGIGVAIVVLLLLVLFFSFRISELQMEESAYYTKEELKKYFVQDTLDQNTVLLYAKLKYGEQIAIPFIQKYDVDMLDGHTLKIKVYDKTIAGCVQYMGEYVYFDKDGMVLEISSELMSDIPLISGVHFKQMKLYDRLAVEDESIFATVMNISHLIKRYEIAVDKVVFDATNQVTLVSNDIKITMGKRDKYDEQIAELSNILPKLTGLKGELDLVGFTPGQQRIVFKEEK